MHLTHATRSLALHPSDPRSPSERQDPGARRALPPATLRSASLSKSPATCSGESTLSFAPLSFLLSDTRGFHGLSLSLLHRPVSSAGCVPYDNSRQAHRSPKFIATFKVVARRPRYLRLLFYRYTRPVSTDVHFVFQ